VSTDEKQVIPDKETIELERKEIQEAKSSWNFIFQFNFN
jgi:hypothetical protein